MAFRKRKFLNSCGKSEDPYKRVLALQEKGDKFYELEYLAYLLNHPKLDGEGNLTPQSALLKRIFEVIRNTKTPNKSTNWVKTGFDTALWGTQFDPAPGSLLAYLNQIAQENPVTLKFIAWKQGRNIKVDSRFEDAFVSINGPFAAILSLLSQYFKKEGWKRLKLCAQCEKYFVDRTYRNNKVRCSDRCTTKWWSWGRRREEGHKLPIKGKKKRKAGRRGF